MNNMFAKCGNTECIQTDCERLESNGCNGSVHSMEKLCNEQNRFLWYEGKNKKENIKIVDGLYETNTNGHEDVENVSDEGNSL